MTQLLINTLSSACLSLLISVSFWLIYATTRTFYITHAATITLGAYSCYWLTQQWEVPLPIAVLISIVVVAVALSVIDKVLFRGLRSAPLGWVGLVASIGLYVVLQNLISLGFGDETQALRAAPVMEGHKFGNAFVANSQILIVVISTFLFAGTVLLLEKTKLGHAIRGVASNPDLCAFLGIDKNLVIGWAIAIGSGLAATGGILSGLDSDINPTMGFRLLMNSVVVMIIGGASGISGLPLAALFLALMQHTAAYYLDAKWIDSIAFLILIIFLIWKPLGLSGRHFKKIEI